MSDVGKMKIVGAVHFKSHVGFNIHIFPVPFLHLLSSELLAQHTVSITLPVHPPTPLTTTDM
jgi:hypothetical protein